jgi:hypothetical protein
MVHFMYLVHGRIRITSDGKNPDGMYCFKTSVHACGGPDRAATKVFNGWGRGTSI